jgi:hypothetical protein
MSSSLPLQSSVQEPQHCAICEQPLRLVKHRVAHDGWTTGDAHVRTCPHNLSLHCYDGPRHDEWHQREQGWVKREL